MVEEERDLTVGTSLVDEMTDDRLLETRTIDPQLHPRPLTGTLIKILRQLLRQIDRRQTPARLKIGVDHER